MTRIEAGEHESLDRFEAIACELERDLTDLTERSQTGREHVAHQLAVVDDEDLLHGSSRVETDHRNMVREPHGHRTVNRRMMDPSRIARDLVSESPNQATC